MNGVQTKIGVFLVVATVLGMVAFSFAMLPSFPPKMCPSATAFVAMAAC